jgi:hypothetical protein
MKLDVDLFSIYMINFEEKRILVCTDQAKTTEGKNVLVFDDLRTRMIKPWNPEVGVWKENVQRKKHLEWKPTSSFLMEKYVRNRWESVFRWLGGQKREMSPVYNYGAGGRYELGQEQPWAHRNWRRVRRVSPVNPGGWNVVT